jgi:hypothetical protein
MSTKTSSSSARSTPRNRGNKGSGKDIHGGTGNAVIRVDDDGVHRINVLQNRRWDIADIAGMRSGLVKNRN